MRRTSGMHPYIVSLCLDPLNVFDGQPGEPAVDAGVEILLRCAFDHACLTSRGHVFCGGTLHLQNLGSSCATAGALSCSWVDGQPEALSCQLVRLIKARLNRLCATIRS